MQTASLSRRNPQKYIVSASHLAHCRGRIGARSVGRKRAQFIRLHEADFENRRDNVGFFGVLDPASMVQRMDFEDW